MKKSRYLILIILFMIVIFFGFFYNAIVAKEEAVRSAYAQIESNLQREVDLLPNLVNVVKKYAQHEETVFENITALRAGASKSLQPQQLAKLDRSLKQSTLQLFAVAENYPQLASSEHFLALQSQIEGAQNRINVSRMLYNEAVSEYNAYIRQFPANIIAKMTGFQQKEYFHADKKAHQTFKVAL